MSMTKRTNTFQPDTTTYYHCRGLVPIREYITPQPTSRIEKALTHGIARAVVAYTDKRVALWEAYARLFLQYKFIKGMGINREGRCITISAYELDELNIRIINSLLNSGIYCHEIRILPNRSSSCQWRFIDNRHNCLTAYTHRNVKYKSVRRHVFNKSYENYRIEVIGPETYIPDLTNSVSLKHYADTSMSMS